MKKRCVRWVLLVLLCFGPVHPGSTGWQMARGVDPVVDDERSCLLRSDKVVFADGYAENSARLVLTPEALAIQTNAPLDNAFGDLELVVDDGRALAVDRVVDARTAVIADRQAVVARFRPGYEAVARLRFWPTWPSQGRVAVTFSLIGFSQGLGVMDQCLGEE